MIRPRPCMKLFLLVSLPVLFFGSLAYAHRSGCHRWHSCPSDRGTYVCGDLGYCSQCPDNQYCQGGQPRRYTASPAPSHTPMRSDVREMQRLLNTLGYAAGAADGIYGPKTRQAIQKFNEDNGLPDTLPIVDARLLAHLRTQVELLKRQRR